MKSGAPVNKAINKVKLAENSVQVVGTKVKAHDAENNNEERENEDEIKVTVSNSPKHVEFKSTGATSTEQSRA